MVPFNPIDKKSLILEKLQKTSSRAYSLFGWQQLNPTTPRNSNLLIIASINIQSSQMLIQYEKNKYINFLTNRNVHLYIEELGIYFKGHILEEDKGTAFLIFIPKIILQIEESSFSKRPRSEERIVSIYEGLYSYLDSEDPYLESEEESLIDDESHSNIEKSKKKTYEKRVDFQELEEAKLLNKTSSLFTKEENDRFYDMRESERIQANGQHTIEITRLTHMKYLKPKHYKLFDLSQGGLSFIILDRDEFRRGEIIKISFLSKRREPLKSKIVSIRLISKNQGQYIFKVGVAFISGHSVP